MVIHLFVVLLLALAEHSQADDFRHIYLHVDDYILDVMFERHGHTATLSWRPLEMRLTGALPTLVTNELPHLFDSLLGNCISTAYYALAPDRLYPVSVEVIDRKIQFRPWIPLQVHGYQTVQLRPGTYTCIV